MSLEETNLPVQAKTSGEKHWQRPTVSRLNLEQTAFAAGSGFDGGTNSSAIS